MIIIPASYKTSNELLYNGSSTYQARNMFFSHLNSIPMIITKRERERERKKGRKQSSCIRIKIEQKKKEKKKILLKFIKPKKGLYSWEICSYPRIFIEKI